MSDTLQLLVRNLRLLRRQPIWIFFMLVQPMFWLLLYSQLFRRVTDLGGFGTSSYIDYLTPGIAVMTAFFSGSWAGMGMIDDLDRGVVERFLATPVHRASIVSARVLGSAVISSTQALIVLVVGLALGATNGGPEGWLVILLAAFLISAGFSGLSNAIALMTRREESMIAIANFIGLPLLFFSSILMARSLIPSWMRDLSLANPVEWAVRAGRAPVLPGTNWGHVAIFLLALAGFTTLMTALATWSFGAYRRTL